MKPLYSLLILVLVMTTGCGGGNGVRGDALSDTDGVDLPSDGLDAADPDNDSDDLPSDDLDAADPEPDGADNPTEATFVINAMSIPNWDVGFNLDDEITACSSGCINDGPLGEDNRFVFVLIGIADSVGVDADFNTKIAESIERGEKLVLLRLVGIPDFTTASGVDMLRYAGVDTDTPASPGDDFSGSEPFDVSAASLAGSATDVDDVLYRFDDGTIVSAEYHATSPSFIVEIPYNDARMRLPIRDAQIRFDIAPEPDVSGGHYIDGQITNGLIGGHVSVQDAVEEVLLYAAELGGLAPTTVMNIVVNQADIDYVPEGPTSDPCDSSTDCPLPWQSCDGGFCYEPAARMDSIGLAVQFTAVSAVFTGNIVTP